MKIARRMTDIRPFVVMEILERARQLEGAGRDIVHMEIGEPDFPTPPLILHAAADALRRTDIKYTPAGGLPELRQAIAAYYAHRYGISLDPRRVFVTPGASGALLLVLGLLVEPGHGVALADPGYPCYPNFVRLFGGEPIRLAVDETSGFNLTASLLEKHWQAAMAGIILASPANPTGSILAPERMRSLVNWVEARQGYVVSDEIYHGLEYGTASRTVLDCSDRTYVINSFSKYFGMTGWRLGWAVVPGTVVEQAERLAQNIFIAAPTLSQLAALAAFDPDNLAELESRRRVFAERRDLLCHGLSQLGFVIRARPEGAFYVYADCSNITLDSRAFARALLETAGVAVTPGLDFGVHQPERYLRFCYTASSARIREGLERIAGFMRPSSVAGPAG